MLNGVNPRKVPADRVQIGESRGYATAANDRNISSSIDVALSPQIVAHLDGSWRKTGDTRSGGYVYAPDIRGDLLHLAEHEVEEDRKSVGSGKSVSVRGRSRWSPYH